MINSKRAITSMIATGALLFSTIATPVFATTLEISGNGSSSENEVKVETNQETTVVQKNDAEIKNEIDSSAKTGGNSANDNTGGSVAISTGDAASAVNLTNTVNLNKANVQGCGTCNGNTDVLISGNGSSSENEVKLENANTNSVYQDNKADIKNEVDSRAKTGYNDANRNTGGDTTILTGNATAGADVLSKANANIASVGQSSTTNPGTLSARILGNGSNSENEIELGNERSVMIVQDNNAKIKNDVDVSAKTGANEANDNTNGDVLIATGKADAQATIDNLANFNFAEADCCLFDVTAKVAGNGSDSENEIKAELGNELSVFQGGKEDNGNKAQLENELDSYAKTGYNDINRNTDPGNGGDPVIVTGDSSVDDTIRNTGNVNLFGRSDLLSIPTGLGLSLDFHFDLSDLLGLLHV